ncbi:MAG: hypothetical protein ACR2N1_12220 [Rubripirellula sp.]
MIALTSHKEKSTDSSGFRDRDTPVSRLVSGSTESPETDGNAVSSCTFDAGIACGKPDFKPHV